MIDAVARLVPGVVGDDQSVEADSFTRGLLDYPHYTRPAEFDGRKVPDVLLSGHHEIRKWRRETALARRWHDDRTCWRTRRSTPMNESG